MNRFSEQQRGWESGRSERRGEWCPTCGGQISYTPEGEHRWDDPAGRPGPWRRGDGGYAQGYPGSSWRPNDGPGPASRDYRSGSWGPEYARTHENEGWSENRGGPTGGPGLDLGYAPGRGVRDIGGQDSYRRTHDGGYAYPAGHWSTVYGSPSDGAPGHGAPGYGSPGYRSDYDSGYRPDLDVQRRGAMSQGAFGSYEGPGSTYSADCGGHDSRSWLSGHSRAGGSSMGGGTWQGRSTRQRGPKGYTRSDERIREDISERLMHGSIDASDVEIDVTSGTVTLSGTVCSRYDKYQIEDLAESLGGVKEVDNQLRIKREDESAESTSSEYAGRTSTGSTYRKSKQSQS